MKLTSCMVFPGRDASPLANSLLVQAAQPGGVTSSLAWRRLSSNSQMRLALFSRLNTDNFCSSLAL
jgi:hypothetical protein